MAKYKTSLLRFPLLPPSSLLPSCSCSTSLASPSPSHTSKNEVLRRHRRSRVLPDGFARKSTRRYGPWIGPERLCECLFYFARLHPRIAETRRIWPYSPWPWLSGPNNAHVHAFRVRPWLCFSLFRGLMSEAIVFFNVLWPVAMASNNGPAFSDS